MKKIGICACYNTFNYGSMLQTLAMLSKLETMGCDCEIINYTRKLTMGLFMRSIERIPEELVERLVRRKKKKQMVAHPEIMASIKQRNECFRAFIKTHFANKLSQSYDIYKQIHEAAKKYSAIMVGSDQLWTPRGYSTGFYNLLFVPDEIPKLAYATSFGVGSIPKNKQAVAKKFLNRMDYISVRELRATEMIKELTGRIVPTVVDPTLLFTGEDWKNLIEVKEVVPNKRYIFCYFLGNNPEHRKEVEKLRVKTGYEIVFIPHLDEFIESDLNFGDKQLFKIGPVEFVNLIRYAEFICTDSFHGSVFSILNHKQFVTFERYKTSDKNSRNSRIDSLLKQTGLQSQRFNGNLIDQINQPINYKDVEARLSQMRARSVAYLEDALGSLEP